MGRTEEGDIPFPCLFVTRNQSLIVHADFHVLIKMFMEKSLERLRGVAGENPVDVTIWSSSLTTEKYIDDISKDDYTIQGHFFSSFSLEIINTNKIELYLCNQNALVFSK